MIYHSSYRKRVKETRSQKKQPGHILINHYSESDLYLVPNPYFLEAPLLGFGQFCTQHFDVNTHIV